MLGLNYLPFGLRRRIRSGINLTIYPVLRCNFSCGYCSQYTYNGEEPPSDNELLLDEWKRLILHLPLRIQQIHYTGGEPFLRKDLLPLLQWLAVERDELVVIYSNFSIYRQFPSHKNIRICTSYHHHAPKDRYMKNLKKFVDDGHDIMVEEIGWHSNLDLSLLKRWGVKHRCKIYEPLDNNSGGMTDRWLFTPDGMLFYDQLSMHRYLNSRYNKQGYLKGESYEERLSERRSKDSTGN